MCLLLFWPAVARVAVERSNYKAFGSLIRALKVKDPDAAEAIVQTILDEMWKLGWAAAKSEEELHVQQQRAALAAEQEKLEARQQELAQLGAVLVVQQLLLGVAAEKKALLGQLPSLVTESLQLT